MGRWEGWRERGEGGSVNGECEGVGGGGRDGDERVVMGGEGSRGVEARRKRRAGGGLGKGGRGSERIGEGVWEKGCAGRGGEVVRSAGGKGGKG